MTAGAGKDWRAEIEEALAVFPKVAELAGALISSTDIVPDYLPAPHKHPTFQPAGTMAVYGFWGDGEWLKIGKVGPNSKSRYTTQHYGFNAKSTVARSLAKDRRIPAFSDFDPIAPGKWMHASTHRINILLPATMGPAVLSLLEAFLQVRLKPRYEGFASQQTGVVEDLE